MTIKEVLKKYSSTEVELLLSHVLGKSKEFLYMNPESKLATKQLSDLTGLIKRRQKGEPIAYILGYKDFCGLRFKVNRSVLIPRPETEWIVEHIGSSFLGQETARATKILDVGTGSGNIAISLAKMLGASGFKFYASDSSKKALAVAKTNAKTHGAKIQFIQSSLFSKIKGAFDIVIANLPYVPKKIYDSRFEDLRYEPKLALTDGTNRFVLYEEFFQQIYEHLNKKASICLEIDPESKKLLAIWAKKNLPTAEIKFYRDLNNLWRYLIVKT